MSPGLTSYLSQLLAGPSGSLAAGPLQFRAIGGGSINTSYQLTYHEQQWFCKINDAGLYPDLFVLERQGLNLLGASGIVRVPAVIDCTIVAGKQVLVLEWIEQGLRTPGFWQSFGEQLAGLHHISQAAFGLDHANYMGSLPQSNTPANDWIVFFERERLQPQVRLARDNGLLDKQAVLQFEKLYTTLKSIFSPEPPALLHGDLWSGNYLCDATSQPVLIDPATYFGHRSIDLAMTTLFGGFERPFYEAYAYHYPFPPNYQEQWEICNLYPLLIHLNLFGLGYLRNILHTIQRF